MSIVMLTATCAVTMPRRVLPATEIDERIMIAILPDVSIVIATSASLVPALRPA
jgi:hypothetical protein